MLDLSGKWRAEAGGKCGEVTFPGIIQSQGFGEKPNRDTEWYSGLHNPFWYEREEYGCKPEGEFLSSFLCQPERVFRGKAVYEKKLEILEENEFVLFLELVRWKVSVLLDGEKKGENYSLCAPLEFNLGKIGAGWHKLTVICDNSMIFPYRPDGHGVSDALGAGWNGIGGKILLLTAEEFRAKEEEKKKYAADHKVSVTVNGDRFFINNKPKYLRGTHFGGDFPLTGIPETSPAYWENFMNRVKDWGFNFVRCHSFCPPDAAFTAADKAGIYLQPECGMWNVFNPGTEMNFVLCHETELILSAFGHHPSFVLFSSTNEPDGNWYGVLREWTDFARSVDERLGYGGRRIYTAQSGWYYDVPPKDITGTDYLYFHRSAQGPLSGGTIRNHLGWKGKDYNPSTEGARLPIICHEMGQWCAYPDFEVIDKYTGYQKPSNYILWRNHAEKNGVLKFNKEFTFCSGRNQLRFLKEDIEANYRTEHVYGYEYLDLHDYSGQGGAMVGILDSFWDNKGYASKEELREIVSDVVILTRLKGYVFKNTEKPETPIEIINFSEENYENVTLLWRFVLFGRTVESGKLENLTLPLGLTTKPGKIEIDLSSIKENSFGRLEAVITSGDVIISRNHWDISVLTEECGKIEKDVLYTHNANEAFEVAKNGGNVVYSPFMSDLDYSCPLYGMRNCFWNAQMGPGYSRQLGLVVDADHKAFGSFPTEHSGGWIWERVLDRARGFALDPKYESIVRCIDDWNRNRSMSLIFETKVGKGKMIVVSADIDGDFEERPECFALRQSLMSYAGSDEFSPKNEIEEKEIRQHIRSIFKSGSFVKDISVSNDADVSNLYEPNPNLTFRSGEIDLPYTISYKLTEKKKIKGLYYLPPQGARFFEGCIKKMTVIAEDETGEKEVASATLENRLLGELVRFPEVLTDRLTLRVDSVYGVGTATVWDEDDTGWHPRKTEIRPQVLAGAIELVYEDSEDRDVWHNNKSFWNRSDRIRQKEIDTN